MFIPIEIQLEYLLRIVVAILCGAAIGYERESRLKTAGVRTHLIVSLAAALIMIVSKYGFNDILGVAGVGLDPSRVASQIVSGVGFLGAGIIFVRKREISGLTTAAGIWATSGVGMAIGAGLYPIGVASTVLLIIVQVILHRNFKWIKNPVTEEITLRLLPGQEDSILRVSKSISARGIEVMNLKAKRQDDDSFEVKLSVRFPDSYSLTDIAAIFRDEASVDSIDI